MAKHKTVGKQAEEQDIQELAERYQDLNTRKIQAETNLKTAKKELAKLRKKAKGDYGTDDPDELQKRLDDLRAENEKKRSSYQASLDEIEKKLKKVEADHGPLEEVEAAEDEDE